LPPRLRHTRSKLVGGVIHAGKAKGATHGKTVEAAASPRNDAEGHVRSAQGAREGAMGASNPSMDIKLDSTHWTLDVTSRHIAGRLEAHREAVVAGKLAEEEQALEHRQQRGGRHATGK